MIDGKITQDVMVRCSVSMCDHDAKLAGHEKCFVSYKTELGKEEEFLCLVQTYFEYRHMSLTNLSGHVAVFLNVCNFSSRCSTYSCSHDNVADHSGSRAGL